MQFIPKTEVKDLQMPGVRCSELWCFIIYWKTGSSTVEKIARETDLTKVLGTVEIFVKISQKATEWKREYSHMRKGTWSLLESAWVHEWGVSGTEGLLKICRALQSVLHSSWENCYILGNPAVILIKWNLGNAFSRASFQNANSNQIFCWNKAQFQPGKHILR